VTFCTTLAEPPLIATPAPKPATVPFWSVHPFTLRNRIPGLLAASAPLPEMVKPPRSTTMLLPAMIRAGPLAQTRSPVRVMLLVTSMPQTMVAGS